MYISSKHNKPEDLSEIIDDTLESNMLHKSASMPFYLDLRSLERNNTKYNRDILTHFENLYKSNSVYYFKILRKVKELACDISSKIERLKSAFDCYSKYKHGIIAEVNRLECKLDYIAENSVKIECSNEGYKESIENDTTDNNLIVENISITERSVQLIKTQLSVSIYALSKLYQSAEYLDGMLKSKETNVNKIRDKITAYNSKIDNLTVTFDLMKSNMHIEMCQMNETCKRSKQQRIDVKRIYMELHNEKLHILKEVEDTNIKIEKKTKILLESANELTKVDNTIKTLSSGLKEKENKLMDQTHAICELENFMEELRNKKIAIESKVQEIRDKIENNKRNNNILLHQHEEYSNTADNDVRRLDELNRKFEIMNTEHTNQVSKSNVMLLMIEEEIGEFSDANAIMIDNVAKYLNETGNFIFGEISLSYIIYLESYLEEQRHNVKESNNNLEHDIVNRTLELRSITNEKESISTALNLEINELNRLEKEMEELNVYILDIDSKISKNKTREHDIKLELKETNEMIEKCKEDDTNNKKSNENLMDELLENHKSMLGALEEGTSDDFNIIMDEEKIYADLRIKEEMNNMEKSFNDEIQRMEESFRQMVEKEQSRFIGQNKDLETGIIFLKTIISEYRNNSTVIKSAVTEPKDDKNVVTNDHVQFMTPGPVKTIIKGNCSNLSERNSSKRRFLKKNVGECDELEDDNELDLFC